MMPNRTIATIRRAVAIGLCMKAVERFTAAYPSVLWRDLGLRRDYWGPRASPTCQARAGTGLAAPRSHRPSILSLPGSPRRMSGELTLAVRLLCYRGQ